MNILVFGAHPDDAEVGMGGTIAKYVKKGHNVTIAVTTIPNSKEIRIRECKNAANVLGAKIELLNINSKKLLFDRELIKKFDELLEKYNPDIVFTHWIHDSHQDHISVANATISALRKNECSAYMYEQTIPGGITTHGFASQMFVSIDEEIDEKLNSILEYKSQIKNNKDWWVYGIKGRAMYRGYQINSKYAEAFQVIKEIKKI